MRPQLEIVRMEFGSHLYGTSTPASDRDWKAVHLPAGDDIVMGRVRAVVTSNTKTDNASRNTANDVDNESFALQRYLGLLAEGQTVALDMLFAPWKRAWGAYDGGWPWMDVVSNRHRLVSRRCGAFVGYCRQQANKYGIKGSRMAAAEKARDAFARAFGMMPNSTVRDWEMALRSTFKDVEHVEFVERVGGGGPLMHLSVCNRMVPFTARVKVALDIFTKLYAEYGQRAEAAKSNQGIDWKALSHAVRVGRQAIELLSTGHMTFPRPEASHLVAIKTGQLPYAAVAEEIETLLADVEAAAAASTLPESADMELIDALVREHYGRQVGRMTA